jgi:hypothetical protein
MGGGDDGKVQETAQERALAQHARDSYTDWKQRWLPLQKQLARSITAAGDENSPQRGLAAGKASTDTAIQFADAGSKLEKQLTATGAGLNSGRAVMATTGLGDDAAKSTGMGLTISDQQMNDAYVEGLAALTSIGQGQRAQVGDAMGLQARQSAQQAQTDASIALENRAGNAELVGQFAGYGLQQGLKGAPGTPQYSYNNDASGMQYSQSGADVMGRR